MKKRPKILVVGSLMMNQGIETSVIPEEGQTVMGEDIKKSPGGKGANQAVQMARLGADVTLIGKIGRDRGGEELVKVCKEARVHTESMVTLHYRIARCAPNRIFDCIIRDCSRTESKEKIDRYTRGNNTING